MMYNNIWSSQGGLFNGMHGRFGYGSGYGMMNYGTQGFIGFPGFGLILLLGIAWVLAIKGYALWHAAKRNEPWWFFFLLIVNTFGAFELFYLIFIAKVLFNSKGNKNSHDTHHGEHGNA